MNKSLRDHMVICNWTPKAAVLVNELHADLIGSGRPIVVVTDSPEQIPQDADHHFDLVFIVPGDPMNEKVLRRASIEFANTAIVLADSREGSYADMKSILTALSIEAIEPKVYTVVELLSTRNRSHFERTHVDEIICTDELLEKLLAQASVTHGVSLIYQHLLTATSDTNELYKLPVPKSFVNRPYRVLEDHLLKSEKLDVILLGYVTSAKKTRDGRNLVNHAGLAIDTEQLVLNPPGQGKQSGNGLGRDHKLTADDKLVVMAYRKPDELQNL